jgi:serine/threonine-protein kinase
VIDERYRIVGLLGRGGMGEVYRADDLKLGRPVALKFLPREVEGNPARLERFLNEVRTALKVTHPNVCRVHDIGETGGQHFLTMEYVDGEDLASLLRRIGRLPEDKAVQIARQLCAGLAAAHVQGILHRDLKPANVMIDGRGRAKITDFGLAGLAETIEGEEIRAGTPLYLSPEQREGREVTLRSDIYALGLVLYELFTGKRAFEAATPAELARMQRESTPSSPSSHVSGLDPAVERAILRCLEREPRQRPASVQAVAAALPGGDPLAAALAAGETPSPEMVADAGEAGWLQPWIGATLLILVLGGLAAEALLPGGQYLAGRVPLDRPPEALSVTARELIERTGHTSSAVDTAYGFSYDHEFLRFLTEQDLSGTLYDDPVGVWPAPIYFWYRGSPDYLVHTDMFGGDSFGFVTTSDPAWTVPGMTGVWLDPRGRLLRFQVVPPLYDESDLPGSDPDWSGLFESAGLDIAEFTPARPSRNVLLDCDTRLAWEGVHNGSLPFPFRVEAGAYRGRPAYFEIVPPWRSDSSMGARPRGNPWDDVFFLVLLLVILIGGLLLARRNVRLGRGDRRGAYRLAVAVFLVQALHWLLRADHVASLGEVWLFFQFLGYGLVVSAAVWLVYLALEPYARRLWPHVLISWSRLLAGRFRDPSIGRDILIGAAVALATRFWWEFYGIVLEWLALPSREPALGSLESLSGVRYTFGNFCAALTRSLYLPIGWLFVLLLLRALLRKQWLAIVVLILVTTATGVVGSGHPLLMGIFMAVAFGVWFLVMVRFGMLCGVFWAFFFWIGADVVLTADPSSWFFGRSLLILLLYAALAVYAFWIARAGRPLFKDGVLTRS